MSVERLIAILGEEFNLSGREIAEVLWLLTQWKTEEEETPTSQPEEIKVDSEVGIGSTTEVKPYQPEEQEISTVEIYAPPPEHQKLGTLPTKALPIWVADPPTIDNTLELMRSLRPLLKKVPVGTRSKLNEPATVDRIAQTDVWLPVLEPELEPWFELALILDPSPSMTLWQRTLEELQLCLKRYGAFRDLRTWELEVNQGKVYLKANATSAPRTPKEILHPDGRCIAIIFSDCVAPYWWDGSLMPTLSQWATAMPTVIWQMFPEWMWERTALGQGCAVSLRATTSGATSQQLQAKALSLWDDDRLEGGTQLPILTTDPDAIAAWSAVVAGKRDITMAGVVWPLNKEEEDEEDEEQENENNQAAARVQRFRLLSSQGARRLAGLLSAAPVITLPVMRLIRASMMPGSSVLPVAEVFLSGLLEPLEEASTQSDIANLNQLYNDYPSSPYPLLPQEKGKSPSPVGEGFRERAFPVAQFIETSYIDLVQYNFKPGVRTELLDKLPKVDALEVLNEVSGYVAERLGKSLREFRALVLNPETAEEEGLKAFAQITAEVLGRLGKEYAQQAAQFARVGRKSPDPPQPEPNAEPQLQEGDFDLATLEEEEETVIFTSDVGTLERERNQWVIRKQKQECPGVIEELPEGVKLELVQIPSGEFTMGSPKNELERQDDEGPHEVNVSGFWMGRYTITQAQWKAIVNNVPTIERELDPDPSRFKGDNRPVEKISWKDAVEFCARLSQYTKKQYVLPSEAQWEYACRAGTITPFHFGETLTTEIANYNGSFTYGEGPKGEYREKTTAVGHFGVTNAFGLYDMHGNVWEWCADPWHSNYEGAPEDGSVWDEEQNDSRYHSYGDFLVNLLESDRPRVLRGGSWNNDPRNCRSAIRYSTFPDDLSSVIGLRVVRLPPYSMNN